MRTSLVAVVAALVIGSGVSSSASPVYDTSALGELTGSRASGGNGLVIGGGNVTSASLSWVITSIAGGYHYSYSFSENSQQSISHFVLDLSDNCSGTSGCLQNVTTSGTYALEYGTFTKNNGNPGLPTGASIVGVKFDTLTSGDPFTFEFDSNRVPVYGDFYTKGGNPVSKNGKKDNGENGFAVYNSGAGNHQSTSIKDFIARPDTVTKEVPEPASLLLLGGGLMLAASRLRRVR